MNQRECKGQLTEDLQMKRLIYGFHILQGPSVISYEIINWLCPRECSFITAFLLVAYRHIFRSVFTFILLLILIRYNNESYHY